MKVCSLQHIEVFVCLKVVYELPVWGAGVQFGQLCAHTYWVGLQQRDLDLGHAERQTRGL